MLRGVLKMDLCILSSVLSIMYTCILHTALALPTAEAPAAAAVSASSAAAQQQQPQQQHHLRTKRCSCATFLDKECVYFCHLDIIWVNTPERVVSYGLGSAPRAKRAAAESMATSSGPRCRCSHRKDETCRRFCHLRPGPPEEQQPGAATRMWNSVTKVRLPPALRTSSSSGLLRRLHRVPGPGGGASPPALPLNPGAQVWDQRQP